MNKRKLALSVFMTVPIVAVSVVHPIESLAENQDWVSEESGLIANPDMNGVNVNVYSDVQVLAESVPTLTATTVQELAALIESGMNQFQTNVSIQYTGDSSMIMEQINSIIKNNLRNNDYLNGTVASWKYGYKGTANNVVISINFDYHTTAEQEAFIQSEVRRIVQEEINPSMSDFEKVKAINDYIVLNSTYSYNSSTTPHAVYAILNEGKGVCQAYALLAYRLLQEAGMEVRYVTGWAGEAHAWNIVKVDGQWYHLDTTWNDPVFSASAGDMSDYVSYKYFLISDNAISQDHQIDDLGYPNATSERFVAMRNVESPIQINKVLYYPNGSDNQKLYKIDLGSMNLQEEKVSDTRVQHLFYANDWLYFSNYSNGGYLYKMKSNGSNSMMLANKRVTKITREGSNLVAYNNNVEIYRESLQENPTDDTKINQVTELSNQIVFLSKDFKSKAEQLFSLFDSLSQSEQLRLSNGVQQRIKLIREKYQKMESLTFNDSTAWTSVPKVNDVKKPWTIQLSQEVLNTPENLKQIVLLDMFGDPIDSSVRVDGKKITVTPMNNYIEGIPYTLVIKSNLKNSNNQTLDKGIHLQFKYQK